MSGRDDRQSGFSLVELLAALVVMTVVLAAALGVTFQSQARSSDRQGEEAARQLTRVALSKLVGEARLAGYRAGDLEPIEVAEPTRFLFVADIDDGSSAEPCVNESSILPRPERITFELQENGTLRRGIQCRNAANTAWIGNTEWINVAEGIDTSAAFFRYFDADGNELGDGVSALGSGERDEVRSLTVGFGLSLDDTARILGPDETISFTGQERLILRNLVLLDKW